MITLTDVCLPEVRRALQADPGVLLVGRSAGPYGARALDLCVAGIYTAADSLAVREGIDVRPLLPANPQALVAHHRTAAAVESVEASGGAAVVHRWSRWSPPAAPELTVLLSTGSAFTVTADGRDQPPLRAIARVIYERRPSVVYAQSLSRFGRGPLHLLADALHGVGVTRADGPFLSTESTSLAEVDVSLQTLLAVQGIATRAAARQLLAQSRLAGGRFAGRRSAAGAGGGAR